MTSDHTNDRELLELAAKAVGYQFMIRSGLPCIYKEDPLNKTVNNALGWKVWNPLTNKADCLQMEIDLGLNVNFIPETENIKAIWMVYKGPFGAKDADRHRASTMVAAEIGGAM